MKVEEFIHSPLLGLPIDWYKVDPRGCEFAINSQLIGYCNLLEHLDCSDEIFFNNTLGLGCSDVKKMAVRLALGLTGVFNEYLNQSNRYGAYQRLKETLQNDIKYGNNKSIKLEQLLFLQRIPEISYRIRYSEQPLLEHKDLFHIPFEQRHLVSDERYSISGNPCLYLSNSLYLCCREKGLMSLKNQYASLIRYIPPDHFKDEQYILDLSINQVLNDNDLKLRYIISWPLLAACNLLVHDYGHKFRCEYLLPQMILNWVMNGRGKIIGVKYNSTKINSNSENRGDFYNLAFPGKSNLGMEYGVELTESFYLTKPVHMDSEVKNRSKLFKALHHVEQIDVSGTSVNYIDSKFSKVEDFLLRQPTYKVINSRYDASDYINLLIRMRKTKSG